MKFLKKGMLQDAKIENALRKAVDDYANGEIVEVLDLLAEIVEALEMHIWLEGDKWILISKDKR